MRNPAERLDKIINFMVGETMKINQRFDPVAVRDEVERRLEELSSDGRPKEDQTPSRS